MSEAIKALDRDMDAVFDSLYILNAAMTAIVQALPHQTSAQVTQYLDRCIDDLPNEATHLGPTAQQMLLGWRNMTAEQAGVEQRPLSA
ncbi:hypothetical protein [Chitinimonas sp.]|uniref:hypothetical protein n=1 Tax=Chitinimonas sp. TaxID=1934313 RepID=UPI0035B02F79